MPSLPYSVMVCRISASEEVLEGMLFSGRGGVDSEGSEWYRVGWERVKYLLKEVVVEVLFGG